MNTKWAVGGWIVAGIMTVGTGALLLRQTGGSDEALASTGSNGTTRVVARTSTPSEAPVTSASSSHESGGAPQARPPEAGLVDKGTVGMAPPSAASPAASTASPRLVAASSEGSPLVLKRLVLARDVQEREPLPLENARTDEPVVAFVELVNSTPSESGIVVTFEHETGTQVGFVSLSVPAESRRYRTWARTRNVKSPGTWTAIVSTADGKELGRESFVVTQG